MGKTARYTLANSHSLFPISYSLFTIHYSPFTIHHLTGGYTETRFAHRITDTNNDSNSATYLRGLVMTRRDHTGACA